MPLFRFRREKNGPDEKKEPAFRHCVAKTGLTTYCPRPAVPGKNLCHFHANLVGPWSKADRVFGEFK